MICTTHKIIITPPNQQDFISLGFQHSLYFLESTPGIISVTSLNIHKALNYSAIQYYAVCTKDYSPPEKAWCQATKRGGREWEEGENNKGFPISIATHKNGGRGCVEGTYPYTTPPHHLVFVRMSGRRKGRKYYPVQVMTSCHEGGLQSIAHSVERKHHNFKGPALQCIKIPRPCNTHCLANPNREQVAEWQ